MRDAAVLPALRAIGRARHLTDRASGRPDLLSAQLARGMFAAGTQLGMVPVFALRATFPLIGQDWPRDVEPLLFGDGPPDLHAAFDLAERQIRALDPTAFDGAAERRVRHRAGHADLDQTGAEYLTLFALPNLWFHLSMAYAILRAGGLDIGKADFDGLHVWPADVTLVD